MTGMSNEQLYYDALKKIARDYQTLGQLHRHAPTIGLEYLEALEMAYDNIQALAADTIRAKRRPKP